MSDDGFFIGWEEPTEGKRGRKRLLVWWGMISGLILGGLIAGLQTTPGKGTFAFGDIQTYHGLLVAEPVPFLVTDESEGGHKVFLLVNPLKYGFPVGLAREHHLRRVSLEGTLVRDEQNGMIEVVPMSITSESPQFAGEVPVLKAVGEVQLKGEIVDSKCHLGVMNPGRFKPHRACAIQCIAGGIPPILVVQTIEGQLRHYLMVGPEGEAIHDDLLDYVAEPVLVRGTYKTISGLHLLFVEPDSLERL